MKGILILQLRGPFQNFDGFFFDCDGVIWEENHLLPGAKDLIEILVEKNKKLAFLSNNSTKSVREYQKKFLSLELPVTADQIMTSSLVTLNYILTKNYKSKNIYIIGENGLKETFQEAGFTVLPDSTTIEKVNAVIVGMDRSFSYKKLSLGLKFCLNGADFIGTNPDPQFPTPAGFFPGAGSMIGALQSALGYAPEKICGKPDPLMAQIMLDRFNLKPEKTIFVGDRVITDMKLAINAKLNPVLIKTGFGGDEYNKYKDFPYYKVIDSLNDLIN